MRRRGGKSDERTDLLKQQRDDEGERGKDRVKTVPFYKHVQM